MSRRLRRTWRSRQKNRRLMRRFFFAATRERAPQTRSNTAIDSTCDVWGNIFTTPTPERR